MVVRAENSTPDAKPTGNKIWRSVQNSTFTDDILKVSRTEKKPAVFADNYGRKEADLQTISMCYNTQSIFYKKND